MARCCAAFEGCHCGWCRAAQPACPSLVQDRLIQWRVLACSWAVQVVTSSDGPVDDSFENVGEGKPLLCVVLRWYWGSKGPGSLCDCPEICSDPFATAIPLTWT